jgi:low affinity Fe/Cu permease
MLKDDAHAQSMLSNVLLRGAPVRVLIQNDVFSMYSKLDEDLLYEMQYTHDSVSAWANGIESAFNTILNKYGYSL